MNDDPLMVSKIHWPNTWQMNTEMTPAHMKCFKYNELKKTAPKIN